MISAVVGTQCGSLPLARSLHDGDVASEREVGKTLDGISGLRPFHFQPIDLRAFSDSQHHTWIVGRQKTAATDFHSAPFQVAGLVVDPGANRVRIRFFAYKTYSKPVVLSSNVIPEKDWSTVD